MRDVLAFFAAVAVALGLAQLAYSNPAAAAAVIVLLFAAGCFVLGPFDPRA